MGLFKKLGIKQLKYPLWCSILFYGLTVLGPIIVVCIEGFRAPDTTWGIAFKFTFSGILCAIVAWLIIKKMIVNKIATKLNAEQATLTLNYKTGVGCPKKTKAVWFANEQKLLIFDAITVLLYGGLFVLLLSAVATSLMKVRGAVLLIMLFYIIAYTIKFMVILTAKGVENESTDDGSSQP